MEPLDAAPRGLSVMEPIELRDLPESGLRYREALGPDAVGRLLGPATSKGPVRFEPVGSGEAQVEVRPLSPEEPPPVRIEGRVRASVGTTCVRCLEAVQLELEAPVESSLFPGPPPAAPGGPSRGKGKPIAVEGGEPLEPWGERFPDPDELDEGTYDGARIPLPDVLGQALLIELPTDPACGDEAACDARTAALLEEANAEARASDAEGDPRWSALRALKTAASEGADGDPSGNR